MSNEHIDSEIADAADGTPFEFTGDWNSRLVATAVHAGTDLRPSLQPLAALPIDERFREEDPYTDRLAAGLPAVAVMHRSRFEVDLNRPRDGAVYRSPEDCWGLEVWSTGELPADEVDRSLEVYDEFYRELAQRLDALAASGPFVVYDVHSYNHRRDGADHDPQPRIENPEINVGTGSLDRARFAPVVDAFIESLRAAPGFGAPLDVRENVRFRGANVAAWVHEHYPGQGAVLAIEFKKTFMDEWTGELDEARTDRLAEALAATAGPVLAALATIAEADASASSANG